MWNMFVGSSFFICEVWFKWNWCVVWMIFVLMKSKKLLFDDKEMMVKWGGVFYNRIINEICYDYW